MAAKYKEEIRSKNSELSNMKDLEYSNKQNSELMISSLNNEIGALKEEIARGGEKKDEMERIRRELRILKKITFNIVEEGGDNGDDVDPERVGAENNEDASDLETVLITKLRNVESDLLTTRRELSDKSTGKFR